MPGQVSEIAHHGRSGFMRRAFIILVLSIILRTAANAYCENAVEQLVHAQSFCMGCAVSTGRILSCDQPFISVLRCKDAAVLLQSVYERGSLEAKMYALAGLREIDRPRFEAGSARITARGQSVVVTLTLGPPSVLRRNAREVLKTIRAGNYRGYVRWIRTGTSPDDGL